MPHREEDEHLPHRAAHAVDQAVLRVTPAGRRYQQADAVFEEERQPGKKLLAEQRSHQRDHHAVDVEHDLEAETGGLEARNDDVLLHAADAVHAERKHEEQQAEVAVRGRAHLLFVA